MSVRRLRDERASLPVAMITVLLVGSITTVLVGRVLVSERQTRFDQGFEQSLQVAETGLDRMVHLVLSGQRVDDFTVAETAVAGGRYQGSARRTGHDWYLEATGTAPDGTSRTVSVTVGLQSVFGMAAYGRTQVALKGNNSADSYVSGEFDYLDVFTLFEHDSDICLPNGDPAVPLLPSHSSDTRMCKPTGHGVVGTNGEMFLQGGVIDDVDRAEVHYASEKIDNPLLGATGFCGGVTATCTSPKLEYFRQPIELTPDPVVPPADLTNQGPFHGVLLPAGRQVYTNVTLNTTTVIEGTPENPTILYITGTLTIPNQAMVNFRPTADGRYVPRPTPGLLIFSAGAGPALRFGNHASFAGAVYAPRATFSGGAAGNVYGSIVTGSVSTEGSWNFHYDEALGAVGTEARQVLRNWAER